jgi:hypothetical protein
MSGPRSFKVPLLFAMLTLALCLSCRLLLCLFVSLASRALCLSFSLLLLFLSVSRSLSLLPVFLLAKGLETQKRLKTQKELEKLVGPAATVGGQLTGLGSLQLIDVGRRVGGLLGPPVGGLVGGDAGGLVDPRIRGLVGADVVGLVVAMKEHWSVQTWVAPLGDWLAAVLGDWSEHWSIKALRTRRC